jgi:hypothetical protein
MEVHEIRDKEGRLFAFEVENLGLGRHGACRVAGKIPGSVVVRKQQRFAISNRDDFCEFKLEGVSFIVEEPFGDNSRYWVGPKSAQYAPEIHIVRDFFARARLWGWYIPAAG